MVAWARWDLDSQRQWARIIQIQKKTTINITGDGSILMNIQELTTCVQYQIPVINVILNNNYLGRCASGRPFFMMRDSLTLI